MKDELTPDIYADISLLPTLEGGKRESISGEHFSCPAVIGTRYFECRIYLNNIEISPGSKKNNIPIKFMSPNVVKSLLKKGDIFHLWESRVIGSATVVSIEDADHFMKLEKLLNELLSFLSTKIPEEDQMFARENISHGEYGIVIESIVDTLIEENISVDSELFIFLKNIFIKMEMNLKKEKNEVDFWFKLHKICPHRPNKSEREISGRWVETELGKVQEDADCRRVRFLTDYYFQEVRSMPALWSTLFLDPLDSRFWELTYPESEMHGGGPPHLSHLSSKKALEKYGLAETNKILDEEDYIFLLTNLNLPSQLRGELEEKFSDHALLSIEMCDELRNLCCDKLQTDGFDENYNLNDLGKSLNDLVDKLSFE